MDFSNQQVSVQELPAIDEVFFHPLERQYLKVTRLAFIITSVIILISLGVIFTFAKPLRLPVIIYSSAAVFILFSILEWVSRTLSFKYGGYALREKDILYRRGWLTRKTSVVPLKRIQHVSVQSGPIERKFGLASISIFTAGSGEADFTIKGITKETAQQIKDWIGKQPDGENI